MIFCKPAINILPKLDPATPFPLVNFNLTVAVTRIVIPPRWHRNVCSVTGAGSREGLSDLARRRVTLMAEWRQRVRNVPQAEIFNRDAPKHWESIALEFRQAGLLLL